MLSHMVFLSNVPPFQWLRQTESTSLQDSGTSNGSQVLADDCEDKKEDKEGINQTYLVLFWVPSPAGVSFSLRHWTINFNCLIQLG